MIFKLFYFYFLATLNLCSKLFQEFAFGELDGLRIYLSVRVLHLRVSVRLLASLMLETPSSSSAPESASVSSVLVSSLVSIMMLLIKVLLLAVLGGVLVRVGLLHSVRHPAHLLLILSHHVVLVEQRVKGLLMPLVVLHHTLLRLTKVLLLLTHILLRETRLGLVGHSWPASWLLVVLVHQHGVLISVLHFHLLRQLVVNLTWLLVLLSILLLGVLWHLHERLRLWLRLRILQITEPSVGLAKWLLSFRLRKDLRSKRHLFVVVKVNPASRSSIFLIIFLVCLGVRDLVLLRILPDLGLLQ